ncbi:MAG: hypothetical protein M0C28_15275 [Candidatus Moduliflexus flocculans]|nr:hypothetical protein [Candidatus Moduliflexus flocculans]
MPPLQEGLPGRGHRRGARRRSTSSTRPPASSAASVSSVCPAKVRAVVKIDGRGR